MTSEKTARDKESAKDNEKVKFNPNMRVPDCLNMKTGELGENFTIFKAMFENYSVAAHLHAESENVQIATFLNIIGMDAFKFYLTLEKTEEVGKETMKGTLDLIERHIAPKKSQMFKR
ncbi:unnamed protein product [Diamesa serratosioi]